MIYQVLRSPTLRPFPGYGTAETDLWETDVCQAVVEYTVKVWKELGKPSNVFLGIDGVVPMAKIRQQRLRRFKSIWTASEEKARGLRDSTAVSWDTNAITPGTAFMEKLSLRLKQLCSTHNWTLSDASEEGEGEQKCMKFWRSLPQSQGNLVIYGLDADLILLCLLTKQLLQSSQNVWCFRETAEWEGGAEKGLGEFMRLSIDKLHVAICDPKVDSVRWTLDYVAGMSFLGNDFVPHGLSLKIREGGHDALLESLKKLHSEGNFLVAWNEESGWTYIPDSVLALTESWESQEERKILEFLKKKAQRINYEDWQMTPCSWKVEEKTLCAGRGVLYSNWQDLMLEEWFGPAVTWDQACKEYARGLQWVLDYYTQQKPIQTTWVYPWSLPPTWSAWRKALKEKSDLKFLAPEVRQDKPIQPQEQLAMVLPLESWKFVRDTRLANLPSLLPHFWPKSYGFFSVGKIFLWECEAEIPLLHLAALRSVC